MKLMVKITKLKNEWLYYVEQDVLCTGFTVLIIAN